MGNTSYGGNNGYSGNSAYQGQGQSTGKVYGGGTMPTDFNTQKQEE